MNLRRFPRTFWAAKAIELFERIAQRGMNTILAITMSFRNGLFIAFSLLAAGYVVLGALPAKGEA